MKENEEEMQTLDKRRKKDVEREIPAVIKRGAGGTRQKDEKIFPIDARTSAPYGNQEIPSDTANEDQGENKDG